MNERIKEIRKALNLTQAKFGQKLNVSGNYIYMIESGATPITDNFIFLLKNALNVNDEWLKSGTGSMFIEHDISDNVSDAIVSLYKRTDISENAKEKLAGILKVAASMSENQINVLIELGHELARLEKENLPE